MLLNVLIGKPGKLVAWLLGCLVSFRAHARGRLRECFAHPPQEAYAKTLAAVDVMQLHLFLALNQMPLHEFYFVDDST